MKETPSESDNSKCSTSTYIKTPLALFQKGQSHNTQNKKSLPFVPRNIVLKFHKDLSTGTKVRTNGNGSICSTCLKYDSDEL